MQQSKSLVASGRPRGKAPEVGSCQNVSPLPESFPAARGLPVVGKGSNRGEAVGYCTAKNSSSADVGVTVREHREPYRVYILRF